MATKSRYKAYAECAVSVKTQKENRAKGIKTSVLKTLKDKKNQGGNR